MHWLIPVHIRLNMGNPRGVGCVDVTVTVGSRFFCVQDFFFVYTVLFMFMAQWHFIGETIFSSTASGNVRDKFVIVRSFQVKNTLKRVAHIVCFSQMI